MSDVQNDKLALRRQDGTPEDVVVVQSTIPDLILAKRIVHLLVEESLVACAHIGQPVTSMFVWDGELDGGEEIPITFKTAAAILPKLYDRYLQLHPYEIPEFLILPVVAGNITYLDWVQKVTLNPGINQCIEIKRKS